MFITVDKEELRMLTVLHRDNEPRRQQLQHLLGYPGEDPLIEVGEPELQALITFHRLRIERAPPWASDEGDGERIEQLLGKLHKEQPDD